MKRMISIMLAATLLALTLCGCGEAGGATREVVVSMTLADTSSLTFEKEIAASAKRIFSDPISPRTRRVSGGKYDYIFDIPEKLDTLYVEPPAVYRTVDVDPISAAVPPSLVYLLQNAPRTNGAGGNGIEFRDADGAKWFTVEAVVVGGGGGGVIVRFHTATEDAIPQKMLLQLGDGEPIESDKLVMFYSQTSMQDGHFSFPFRSAEGDILSEEEIMSMLTGAEVTLTVVQAKVMIPSEEMQITSEDVKLVIK